MSQPLVLAIEPDLRQAAIVKRIVREKALADVVVVDSRDAALEAMRTAMPDVLLLSALMSPRDEDELIAYLKTLENAGHLQTHTIPQLASTLGPGEERASRGLLSAFRRKKDPAPLAPGCDPDLFADEIRMFLQRAADKKRLQQNADFTAPDMRPSAVATTRAAAAEPEEQPAGPSSSWSSPFEWKPAGSSKRAAAPAPNPVTPEPVASAAPVPEPWAPEPLPEPAIDASPAAIETPSDPAPIAVPAAATPEPVLAAAPEPVLAAVPEPIVAPIVEPPVAAKTVVTAAPPVPVAATAPAPKAPPAPAPARVAAPEPSRLKPVADRPAKLTGRVQSPALLKKSLVKDSDRRDRLGALTRWARMEAPRPVKGGPVTADDVRALMSSLALPSDVASVTYPRGCRIRRLRVPVSRDQDAVQNGAPVAASRRGGGERDKHQSA